VFALTYQAEFFRRIGFERVDKGELPHKVWRDCLKCTKFPNCDETAVLKIL
jgi:amino-acid N-acetyltransferase